MRVTLVVGIAVLVTLALACEPETEYVIVTPTPVPGVLLPLPEDGSQYRMSEVCRAIEDADYDVRGTLHHTFDADDFSGLLENLPSLARRPVENYIGDGVRIEIEVRDLCGALNR